MAEKIKDMIISTNQSYSLSFNDIELQLQQSRSWQDKTRTLMKLGKLLTGLPEALKVDSALVQGCESKVWLQITADNNQLYIAATSDAKIIKGLLVIIIALCQQQSLDSIKSNSLKQSFAQLNLSEHLSPSRNNGINAIINTIEQFADQTSVQTP